MIGKQAFVSDISKKLNLNKQEVENVINCFLESFEEFIVKGERISLQGLFSLDINNRASRKGKNPKTGEEIIIPSRKVISFKVSQNLKGRINEN